MDDLPSPVDAEIITVRPQHDTATLQKLPYFVGISGATAGSQGISMNLVIIPPGASAKPHFHKDYETAIYILKGRVKTAYGKGLAKSIVNEALTGDKVPRELAASGIEHRNRAENRAVYGA